MSEQQAPIDADLFDDVKSIYITAHYGTLIFQAQFLEQQAAALMSEAKQLREQAIPLERRIEEPRRLMARTALTVNDVPIAGLVDPAATTGTADGHYFANDGRVMLEFNNANASSRIVTLQTPATLGPYSVEDKAITIPGSASRYKVADIQTPYFNRPSGQTNANTVYLDYPVGQHTDITVRAFSV